MSIMLRGRMGSVRVVRHLRRGSRGWRGERRFDSKVGKRDSAVEMEHTAASNRSC
jgi:hypothetical protein